MTSQLVRWAVAGVTVLALFVGGLFLGLVLMLSGSAGDEEEYYAAQEEICPGVAPRATPGQIRHPMTGTYRTTSDYGWRVDPFTGARSLHGGIDFQHVQSGQPVIAALDGMVVQSLMDPTTGYGNYVDIDHGGGLVTRYAHLQERSVTKGQEISAGEQVGIEGTTGRSTGDHLHFEVRQDGQATDPRGWLTEAGMTIPPVGGDPVPPGSPVDPGPPEVETTTASVASTGGTSPVEIGGYSGEQLVNAGHIIQAGLDRGLDEWELSVAVMTAIGESSLVNIDYGDEAGPDSRGLFQQRASWGTEEQRMHPPTAAGFFYDALVEVPGYRDLAPTIAAHRTQRNADPFHYQQHWQTAARIVAEITGDDDFLKDLPPGGGDPGGGCLPPGVEPVGPIGQCPATSSPAEAGLSEEALYLLRCTYEAHPVPVMYGVGARANPNSDHPAGRAVDFAIADYRSPEGNRYGWELAHWVVGHAGELDVKYVIFDMQIWTPEGGWGPYTEYGQDPGDSLAHRDHVHVSVLGGGSR